MDTKNPDKNISGNLQRGLTGLLSLVGLGIMSYLTYIHFSQVTSFCNLSEKISCDIVTTGIYSEIFGIPVSILGIIYFLIVLLLLIFNKRWQVFQTIFLLTLLVIFPSLYLTLMELLVIKAWCILCELSKITMLFILLITGIETNKYIKITGRLVAPIIIAGIIVAGVTFFAQTGNVTQADHSEFVECLNKQGIVYYKSVRCSNCQRQEKLLGEAYQKLNAVECHPEGKNAQPELCLQKGIDKTPTFLKEENGQEVKRQEGLTSLPDLARFSGCEFNEK
jgi:uncharacterized membrane protein